MVGLENFTLRFFLEFKNYFKGYGEKSYGIINSVIQIYNSEFYILDFSKKMSGKQIWAY